MKIKDNKFWNQFGISLCVILCMYLLYVAVIYNESWWLMTIKASFVGIFIGICYLTGKIYDSRRINNEQNV